MQLKGKYIILEKLSGEKYRPDMLVGDRSIRGYCLEPPKVGYQFFLFYAPKDVEIGEAVIPKEDLPCSWTSIVKEIDWENNIIKTANSVYKFEIKEDEK